MRLYTHAPHESRMCPIDFVVKGQGHGALMIENGFWTITDPVINLWSWKFIHLLPMSQGCTLFIFGWKGQRSRSLKTGDWKRFPDQNWLCNPPMIMKLHTLAPYESRMCPIDFGGQRSWGIDDWKWFPGHNWLCNPPMVMKLHTLSPHESMMCPIDFGVKRSKVKVMWHKWLKTVSGPVLTL